MQQYPGYQQPAPAPTKPANNNLLWLAFASLLCWCIAPVSLILGLLARNDALGQGAPMPKHARLAMILGAVGTGLFAVAAVADAASSLLASKSSAPLASATAVMPPASAAPTPPGRSEEDLRAERAREAAVLESARGVTKDRARLETTMSEADAALAAHQVGKARRTVDGLWSSFVSLDRAYLIPDDNADAATRDVITTASRLLSRYDQLGKAVEANELVVFDAAFNALWDPKNAQRDESALYAGVGKKFGLTGAEVQAIYRRNEAEADRRLKARGDAESRALNPKRR
jgi:hypothetical protein